MALPCFQELVKLIFHFAFPALLWSPVSFCGKITKRIYRLSLWKINHYYMIQIHWPTKKKYLFHFNMLAYELENGSNVVVFKWVTFDKFMLTNCLKIYPDWIFQFALESSLLSHNIRKERLGRRSDAQRQFVKYISS